MSRAPTGNATASVILARSLRAARKVEGRRLHIDANQRLAKLRGINSIYFNGSKNIDICQV